MISATIVLALAATACGQPKRLPAIRAHSSAAPVGLALPWSAAACGYAAADADADGLDDRCELALARAFAPLLVVASGGCNWDGGVTPARLGGGYFFGVRPTDGAAHVRIAYLPAYYRDCGWHGAKCLLPFVSCAPHVGDSEAILVDARHDAASGRWLTEGVFLSAHCFGHSHDDCRWYRDGELDRFDWEGAPRGAPVVWVAEGRQANYPDPAACNRGHWHLDSCDRDSVRVRFPVVSARQDVGSRVRPVGGPGGCVGPDRAAWGSRRVAADARECFWSPDTRFRGWQGGLKGSGATPYARYLRDVAGF